MSVKEFLESEIANLRKQIKDTKENGKPFSFSASVEELELIKQYLIQILFRLDD